MQYINYDEYQSMGGDCDATLFYRNIVRACSIIDNATHGRIRCMCRIPIQAKELCRDLVGYLASNVSRETIVSSKSQSAGAVSESESYVVKSKEEMQNDIDDMVYDYLVSVRDDRGTSLLYRG